jgi:hypothetical protein
MHRFLQVVAIAIALLAIFLAVMSFVGAAEVKHPFLRGLMVLFAIGAAGYTLNDVREIEESLTRPFGAIAIGIVSLAIGYGADQGAYYYGKIFNNTVEDASRNGAQLDSTLKATGNK